jgi:glucosylceramidase
MGFTRITSTATTPWRVSNVVLVGASPAAPTLTIGAPEGVPLVGFGGCFNELGWKALQALSPDDRDHVLDLLFGPQGLHFEVGRLPMGASDYALEWHSYDETDGDLALDHFTIDRDKTHLIPYVKAALARNPGLRLFASPWSPPTWMKFPKAYNWGTLRWEPAVLDAYARYFAKYVAAYRAEGVNVAQVHVQNEPLADQKFPSCLWTGAQLRDFIRGHLGPVMARLEPSTEVWLGTINAPFHNYVLEGLTRDGVTQGYDQYAGLVLADPEARRFIAGVGYQWGGKNAIERTHESWPQLRLVQTENECGDGQNSWEYAQYVFNLVRHYFKHGVEAYTYWNMVLPEGGDSTWGWKQNTLVSVDLKKGTYTLNPEFYLFRHVCSRLQPGAVRRSVTGPWAANALVFANPDGSTVVVVSNPLDTPRDLVLDHNGTKVAVTVAPGAFETLVLPGS